MRQADLRFMSEMRVFDVNRGLVRSPQAECRGRFCDPADADWERATDDCELARGGLEGRGGLEERRGLRRQRWIA